MVSGLTRNQVPGNRLRVRIPCPPLLHEDRSVSQEVNFCQAFFGLMLTGGSYVALRPVRAHLHRSAAYRSLR
jgi:hypothetical protein